MNRRDFLHPRRFAKVASGVLEAVDEIQQLVEEDEETAQEMSLLRFGRSAMATSFEVLLPFGTSQAIDAANEALDVVDQLESQLTIYRDDSEASHLNRRAFREPIVIEDAFFSLLSLASELHEATGGAFDVTTGALTKCWGFHRREGKVPNERERELVLRKVGMQHVRMDPEHKSVRFLRQGLEINLGSIGKGYALDRAVQHLRRNWNIPSALVHGGKSSIVGLGSEPGSKNGWTVGIKHPWDPVKRLATVRLRNKALATSAATFQHIESNGKKLGHVLDPRTGWPAAGIASSSAIAPTGAEADALATAFFILGVEKTKEYCETHPHVGAIILPDGEEASPFVFGLGEQEFTLCTGITSGNSQQ